MQGGVQCWFWISQSRYNVWNQKKSKTTQSKKCLALHWRITEEEGSQMNLLLARVDGEKPQATISTMGFLSKGVKLFGM